MFDATELAVLRRAYARQVMFLGRADNPALEDAYASVPREAYLGPGPWPILRWPGGYLTTPDADPAWLYADVGYFSAIMQHMAGPSGALTAIEFDAGLAARAAANLAHLPGARVVQGD